MLATSWRQTDDLTWEFELRDGVTFHDGQPFTAEDVKASLELASGFSGESGYSTATGSRSRSRWSTR